MLCREGTPNGCSACGQPCLPDTLTRRSFSLLWTLVCHTVREAPSRRDGLRVPPVTKAIFTTKIEPSYDDLPEERYHFPRMYLRQVEAAVGDWIIYYEPRRSSLNIGSRGGRQAYFATARVQQIMRDPGREDHFYAFVSDYLEFDRSVPFKDGALYYESSLQRDDGQTKKGAFGRAVRSLPDREYDLILKAGFARTLIEATPAADLSGITKPDFEEETTTFERPTVEMVIARPFREAAFAASVKAAYAETCAFTGLRIINGGGRAEVQAAHIRPVAAGGSDSVRNGLALSATVHWMFDRGLISISQDFSILVARDRLPDAATRLFREDGKAAVPRRPDLRPHPAYLSFIVKIYSKADPAEAASAPRTRPSRFLFAAIWDGGAKYPSSITLTDAREQGFNRILGVYGQSRDGWLTNNIEESRPLRAPARRIQTMPLPTALRVHVITDRPISERLRQIPDEQTRENVPITFQIWDVTRLKRIHDALRVRDDLVVDFSLLEGGGLPVLPASVGSGDYDGYLAVIPGEILAEIYIRHGSRLLEGDVRTFLGRSGKVNKGIAATAAREPSKFFAYDNGIAATASELTTINRADGSLILTSASDLQIVNGAQTTASLASAREKTLAAGTVFVPMKLSLSLRRLLRT